jgi:hypothetical protein
MKRKIKAAIKADKRKLTAKVGNSIVVELAKRDVKEAFWHLKRWYQKAVEMQARPCRQTMEHQTDEQEELYAERAAYGKAFPVNGMPYAIGNNQSIESKLRAVFSLLSHGRCRGVWGIRAEHIKAWLRGAKKEEDLEMAASHTLGLVRCGTSCLPLLFHLEHRHHSPANVLGDYGPNSEGRGGVPWHQTTRTDMESAQKGDEPQAGGYCLAR